MKQTLLILFLWLGCSGFCQAQNYSAADSLLNLAENPQAPDSLRVQAYLSFTQDHIKDLDSIAASQYLVKANTLAAKTANTKAAWLLARNHAYFLAHKGNSQAAHIMLEKILTQRDAVDSLTLVNTLLDYMPILYDLEKFELGLTYATENYTIARIINYNTAKALYHLGRFNYYLKNYKISLNHFTILNNVYTNNFNLKEYNEIKIYLGRCFYNLREKENAIKWLREALAVAEEYNLTEQIALTNQILALLYYAFNEPDSSKNCIHRSRSLYINLNDSINLSWTYYTLSKVFAGQNRTDSARYYTKKLIAISEHHNDLKHGIWDDLLDIGHEYLFIGDLQSAFSLFYQAMEFTEINQSKGGRARVYQELSAVHLQQEDTAKAMQCLDSALALSNATGNPIRIADARYYLAELYLKRGQPLAARKQILPAIATFQQMNENYDLIYAYLTLGNTWTMQPDTAQKYYKKAIALEAYEPFIAAKAYIGLGKIYINRGLTEQAMDAYQKALQLAEKDSHSESMALAAQALYPLYEQMGELAKAYATFKIFHANNDSLFNKENTRSLVQKEMEYAHEKEMREQEIVQQQAAAAQQQQLREQRWLTLAFVGGFLAMIIIALLVLRSSRQRRRANALLQEQYEEISQQNEEISQQRDMLAQQTHTLAQQAEELKAQHETISLQNGRLDRQLSHIKKLGRLRTQLTHMAAHDLKNPLNVVMGLASMPPSPENQALIHDNSRRMLQLVLNMLDVDKLETEQLTLKKKAAPLGQLLEELKPQIMPCLEAKRLHYHQEAKAYTLQADDSLLLRVLVNLLNNAIKYTPVGGHITLSIRPHGGALRFEVTDTGEGIPPEDLPHIFDKYYQSQQGRKRHSSGLGLTFCQLVVQAHGGQIGARSTPGQGSTMWFTLPWQPQEAAAPETAEALLSHNIAPRTAAQAGPLLSKEDQRALAPILPQLQALRVNQLSEAKAILKTTVFNSAGLKQWKEALLDALYACDAPKYNCLTLHESTQASEAQ